MYHREQITNAAGMSDLRNRLNDVIKIYYKKHRCLSSFILPATSCFSRRVFTRTAGFIIYYRQFQAGDLHIVLFGRNNGKSIFGRSWGVFACQ